MEVLMKNKYQKPAIYLTPEHTEGIYLASGAAGAAGSVTATFMGVWDRWAGGGKGLVAVNWNNVAGNVALTLSFNTPIDQVEVAGYSASTSISGNSVTVSFNPDGGSSFNLGLHVNHSGADINSLDMTGQSYTVS
jgi:Pe-pgrs family protein